MLTWAIQLLYGPDTNELIQSFHRQRREAERSARGCPFFEARDVPADATLQSLTQMDEDDNDEVIPGPESTAGTSDDQRSAVWRVFGKDPGGSP